MFHFIITVLLGITTSIFGLLLYYCLKRINVYELIILKINDTIIAINHQLKLIDDTGHFEADDEIGFFFDEIKDMGNQLNELFENEEEVVDEEKEKKKE